MRPHRSTLLAAAVVLSLLIALVVPFATRDAEAAPLGLKFPALAGTQWKTASGYNTATHLGVDPYALDLVRADGAPTAGSPVLAPVSGTLGGGGTSDCAWIRAADVTVLICHIITEPYARNASITQGQLLGTVAPEGQKGNNGLPHIHLAVNLGGSSGTSLPFDGDYTLDGVRFPATTESNAYSGAPIVTSTNVAVAGAPGTATPTPRATSTPRVTTTSTPAPTVAASATRGRIVSGVVQMQGISLVMFGGGTSAELVSGAGCGTTSATFWVTVGGRFVGYIPAALVPEVNAEWDALFATGIPVNTAMIVRCR